MNKISLKEQELVLKVSDNVDIDKWNETKYYEFIEQLTNGRKYQEEAILTALRFFWTVYFFLINIQLILIWQQPQGKAGYYMG